MLCRVVSISLNRNIYSKYISPWCGVPVSHFYHLSDQQLFLHQPGHETQGGGRRGEESPAVCLTPGQGGAVQVGQSVRRWWTQCQPGDLADFPCQWWAADGLRERDRPPTWPMFWPALQLPPPAQHIQVPGGREASCVCFTRSVIFPTLARHGWDNGSSSPGTILQAAK